MKNKESIIFDKISSAIQSSTDFTKKECDEITFHMTDWLADLTLIFNTFDSIELHTEEEISENIMKFLIHAPEHINKASNLFVGTDYKNIFDDSEE